MVSARVSLSLSLVGFLPVTHCFTLSFYSRAGMLMVLYSREFYAQFPSTDVRVPNELSIVDKNSWMPYSWQIFAKHQGWT